MKVSEAGDISSFCCKEMDEYSRKPQKCISFDLWWRKYEMDGTEPRATIFTLDKSGIAIDQSSFNRPSSAGQQPIPISYCPWCGKKIEFL